MGEGGGGGGQSVTDHQEKSAAHVPQFNPLSVEDHNLMLGQMPVCVGPLYFLNYILLTKAWIERTNLYMALLK